MYRFSHLWYNVCIVSTSGPVFCLLLGVSSDYAQPITGQVTEVTCPVIGWAQPELTPSKRPKTGPDMIPRCIDYTLQPYTGIILHKQRFLTPGHQGWNDLHSLCRIGMEYYLLNNDDNNIIYWIMMIIMIMMMIIIMIIMMTMMIIGTATIMIMIIIMTTTLTMTIMKMIMIKTAHQTPCQSLYKDRRI